MSNLTRYWRPTFCSALLLAYSAIVSAFDPTKVNEGLYYNGTNVNAQMWTPLVLAQDGKLIDPFLYAMEHGVSALEGPGKTSLVRANSSFLYGICGTKTKLTINPSLIAKVSTIAVMQFDGKLCSLQQEIVLENFRTPAPERGDNPLPTFLVNQPNSARLWAYGVPGMLGGKSVPIYAWSSEELGGTPETINGVISRITFVPMPVVEPDEREIARANNRSPRVYKVGLGEAVHRGNDVVVSPELLKKATGFVKDRFWPRYFPRLEAALANRFGGIEKSYFELMLIQGVDIDNTRSFDYIGVARMGVITKAGAWRWVDVVWCWRTGLQETEPSLTVLRTTEPELYDPANKYFSEKRPSLWSPNLVVSGFADFDKDKRLEVVSSLVRSVGNAYPKATPDSGVSYGLWLRDSAIHAWEPDAMDSRSGRWVQVFKTVVHEDRLETLQPQDFIIERSGE